MSSCGVGGVRVCCINATVMCVNVLLFGPITADTLGRGPREPGSETLEPVTNGQEVSPLSSADGRVMCVCRTCIVLFGRVL